ncbi:hypothetical protein TNCV_1374401 [Trichonephila clavipes]|nr:hypothetical protein TNCV_1374401 [Trichonephila clavipes]
MYRVSRMEVTECHRAPVQHRSKMFDNYTSEAGTFITEECLSKQKRKWVNLQPHLTFFTCHQQFVSAVYVTRNGVIINRSSFEEFALLDDYFSCVPR